jgi:hypothetical protein
MNVAPSYGGVHPGEGTRNSLLSLGDSTYIEILSIDPGHGEELDPELRKMVGSGIYHWAASGTDLQDLRKRAEVAGLEGGEIMNGGRSLPNGNRLNWKVFGVKNHGFGALIPFFIDWLDSAHPARTAPYCGALLRLEASSPRAAELQRIYKILGLDIQVAQATTASLSAIVTSRSGHHELRMFDPVPRGYVI